MRKKVINPDIINGRPSGDQSWLDLEQIASIEITSEDPDFPIESALIVGGGRGWRASGPGRQVLRILFDNPRRLHRIWLEFSETHVQRTQEFTLAWSPQRSGPLTEIVRQQWTFSPQGSIREVEDYQVDLDGVSVLELSLKPDLVPSSALATLVSWRLA